MEHYISEYELNYIREVAKSWADETTSSNDPGEAYKWFTVIKRLTVPLSQ